jgi:hypothetical protein
MPIVDSTSGSIGNLASAATVAASSFDMKATDPTELIQNIDVARWNSFRQQKAGDGKTSTAIAYVEPAGEVEEVHETKEAGQDQEEIKADTSEETTGADIVGKVCRLGEMVDTDAASANLSASIPLLTIDKLAPAEYIIYAHSNEAIGKHCLEYTDPEFRERVKQGFNVVVAGKGFGCGSSRMEAVMALLGMSFIIVSAFITDSIRMWRQMRHRRIFRIHIQPQLPFARSRHHYHHGSSFLRASGRRRGNIG